MFERMVFFSRKSFVGVETFKENFESTLEAEEYREYVISLKKNVSLMAIDRSYCNC